MSNLPYIPVKQGNFLAWLSNFTSLIVANPTQYGLTAPQASEQLAFTVQYQNAYVLALDPSTRTQSTVAAKDNARVAAEQNARRLAQLARQFLLSDPTPENYERMEDLGLKIPDPTPTPVPAPATFPVISSVGTNNGQIVLTWTDSDSPAARRKPPGAIAMQLWGVFGEVAAVSTAQMEYLVQSGRIPYTLTYASEMRGKVGSFAGRWVSARGLTGPWSTIFVSYLA